VKKLALLISLLVCAPVALAGGKLGGLFMTAAQRSVQVA